MDGRDRALDNIFIERLWRSLKYEAIYLKDYATVPQLYEGLTDYFHFYNQERPHQSLDYRVPQEVYQAGRIHLNQPQRSILNPPYSGPVHGVHFRGGRSRICASREC